VIPVNVAPGQTGGDIGQLHFADFYAHLDPSRDEDEEFVLCRSEELLVTTA
jgi:hypothetical protein